MLRATKSQSLVYMEVTLTLNSQNTVNSTRHIYLICFLFLDGGDEVLDFMKQDFMMSEEADLRLPPQRDTHSEELLRQAQEKLKLKEAEVKWESITVELSQASCSV